MCSSEVSHGMSLLFKSPKMLPIIPKNIPEKLAQGYMWLTKKVTPLFVTQVILAPQEHLQSLLELWN